MRFVPSLVFAGVLLSSAVALAAGDAAGEHHGPDWFLLGLQVFNLAILVFILFRFARQPLRDFLKQRAYEIRHQIETAETSLADAEREIASLRSRLDAFETEKSAFIADAEATARAEAERHVARANESSIRIQEDAIRVANQEIARARTELQAEAASLATKLAGEMLRGGMTPDDDRRIVAEFVERVGSQS